MGVGVVTFRHHGAQGGRSAYPQKGPFQMTREEAATSDGHIGYSWTIEGGIVEVFRCMGGIIRAPLSNVLDARTNVRNGRLWWPDDPRYADQWEPLTFATIAEAEQHRAESY